MTRFASVHRALGMILMLFGLALLAPLVVSHSADDGAQRAYDLVFLLTELCGTFLWYRYRHRDRKSVV